MDIETAKRQTKSLLLWLAQANQEHIDPFKRAQAEKIFRDYLMKQAGEEIKEPVQPTTTPAVQGGEESDEEVIPAAEVSDSSDDDDDDVNEVMNATLSDVEDDVKEGAPPPISNVIEAPQSESEDEVEEKEPPSPVTRVEAKIEMVEDYESPQPIQTPPRRRLVEVATPSTQHSEISRHDQPATPPPNPRFRSLFASPKHEDSRRHIKYDDSDTDDEDEMFTLPLRSISKVRNTTNPDTPLKSTPSSTVPPPSTEDTSSKEQPKKKVNLHDQLHLKGLKEKCRKICDHLKMDYAELIADDGDMDDWEWQLEHLQGLEAEQKTKSDMKRILHSTAFVVGTATEMFKPGNYRGDGLRDYVEEHETDYERFFDRMQTDPTVSALFNKIPPIGDVGSTFLTHFLENSRRVTLSEKDAGGSGDNSEAHKPSSTHETEPKKTKVKKDKKDKKSKPKKKRDKHFDKIMSQMFSMQQQQQQYMAQMMQMVMQQQPHQPKVEEITASRIPLQEEKQQVSVAEVAEAQPLHLSIPLSKETTMLSPTEEKALLLAKKKQEFMARRAALTSN